MSLKNKKGEVNIVVVVLLVMFVVAISTLVFTWMKKTAVEGNEKSADKVAAQDICNENVKILVNNIVDNGNNLDVYLENTKAFPIDDFVVRMENGDNVDVRKVKQILGSYERVILNVGKPSGFNPRVIKIIPRITLSSPDISSVSEGWWICSKQLAKYEMF